MISQGASKVNISLIVNDSEAEQCVRALHSAFFESDLLELVSGNNSGNGSVWRMVSTGFMDDDDIGFGKQSEALLHDYNRASKLKCRLFFFFFFWDWVAIWQNLRSDDVVL